MVDWIFILPYGTMGWETGNFFFSFFCFVEPRLYRPSHNGGSRTKYIHTIGIQHASALTGIHFFFTGARTVSKAFFSFCCIFSQGSLYKIFHVVQTRGISHGVCLCWHGQSPPIKKNYMAASFYFSMILVAKFFNVLKR